MSGPALLAALALFGQGIPPELRVHQQKPIDPALPPTLAQAIAQASEAELDPKRGPGNAAEILKAAREKQASTELKLALDLRIAATVLRARFIKDTRLPEPERPARALSTFSKLDLIEPGLRVWLDRAVAAAAPEARGPLSDPKQRRLKVHAIVSGASLDPGVLVASLGPRMKALGFEVVRASAADAELVLRLAALEVRDEGGQAYLRASLDLSSTRGPEPRWKKSLFRTVVAKDAKIALEDASDWLVRMGGRELLFWWLESRGMKGVTMAMPGGHDHDHADEGPKVSVAPTISLPSGGKEPAPQGSKR